MYTQKKYKLFDMVKWTRMDTYIFVVVSLIPLVLYKLLGFRWLQLPWLPIALIGTAVAFIIGFQNNVTYGRIWEARKIWGGIVNFSRSWTMMVKDMVTNEYAQEARTDHELKQEITTLVYRHIAWITALRHAMRQARPWELFMKHKTNAKWSHMMNIPERTFTLEEELSPLLTTQELKYVMTKTNKPATLLSMQSKHLRQLKESGHIWEFSFLELEGMLKELFNLQGKSERIKNFPYPRQYATLNHYFVWIFLFLLPFGLIPAFDKMGFELMGEFPQLASHFVWLAIPFGVVVSWVFHTMERIGRAGENPFEGTANDVPISTIARGIEIDLREMLDENADKIPEKLAMVYDVQM